MKNIFKKIIIILLFIFIITICFAKEDKYINGNYGFSFKIINNIKIVNDLNNFTSLENLIKNSMGKYFIKFDIFNINDLNIKKSKTEIISMLKNRESILIRHTIDKYENGSKEFYKYQNDIIGEFIFDIGSPIVGWEYNKVINFIKDNYMIKIMVIYCDPQDDIAKRYPNFFEYVEGEGYYWKEPISNNCKQFYNLIKTKSKEAPKELIKLEEYFDEIINSLELFDPKSIFYIPTVSTLRFRETPDLNGKFIRSINQNEKLELIEKGKEETINNVKGHWVKVKTEKGEVGWCFDAYLEEVKKK